MLRHVGVIPHFFIILSFFILHVFRTSRGCAAINGCASVPPPLGNHHKGQWWYGKHCSPVVGSHTPSRDDAACFGNMIPSQPRAPDLLLLVNSSSLRSTRAANVLVAQHVQGMIRVGSELWGSPGANPARTGLSSASDPFSHATQGDAGTQISIKLQ